MRKTKGYSKTAVKKKGKYYGRLRINATGDEFWTHQAKNKTHARQLTNELEAKYISGGIEALDAEDMTVADLAAHYRKVKVVDAVYNGDIKVSGMIARGSADREVRLILEYWGAIRVQAITHADLEEYKTYLFQKPTVWRWRKGAQILEKPKGTPRTMSSVNHLLRRLRIMLNFAMRKGWIAINPFSQGDPLISQASETERNRAEKSQELQKLLNACTGRREYLRPIILIMSDSALRLTEAKRITRANLDLARKVAYVRARNTKKNMQTRIVPLSDRLVAELQIWCDRAESDDVPILRQYDHKKAWKAVKKEAGITDDLQLRDLRGWGTSKIAVALAAADLPWEWGMKATGHTQTKTYQRYIKIDEEIAKQTGEALKNLEDKAA